MSGATSGWGQRLGVGEWRNAYHDIITHVPRGDSIPEERWWARHRNILILLWAHVPFLFLLGIFDGHDPYITGATYTAVPLQFVLLEVGAIAALALLASWTRFGRRTRTILTAAGLMTCSAVLAHFWGGFIEAHFHFFVMVGVIAAYEDWLPFVLAILYVAVQHGVFGMLSPGAVYNHSPAIENPWGWAFIHAVFVLGLAAAIVSHWLSIERSRAETERKAQAVRENDRQIEGLKEKQAEIEAAREALEEAKSEAEARQNEVEKINEELLIRAGELATAMDAASDGDFTADPPKDADIEAIVEISEAFESMTRELSATIVDLQTFAATVETTTDSVRDDAASLERTQRQLVEDVREFAADLREQADDLESTTDELTALSATIEEIAASAEQVSEEASDAAAAAQSGTETATEAIEAIERIERSVGELDTIVESLDGRMDDVAESTAFIEEIADQTNMLALNANIEAARAGSDGASFTVVAEEVKTLADETQDHSAAIQETIERTIDDVERVQAELRETKAQIETGKVTVTDAGDAFEALTETVEDVDSSIGEVAAATDDGARTTQEVVDAVTRVAESSREIAAQSDSLADRAEDGATTIATVRSQLDDLAEQTTDLQQQLDAFTCRTDGKQAAVPDSADD